MGFGLAGLVGVKTVGIEHAVADELEGTAVEGVGAGLHGVTNDSSAGAAVFGRVGIGKDAELADRFHLRNGRGFVAIGDGVGGTIEQDVRRGTLVAVNAERVGEALAEHVGTAGVRTVLHNALREVDKLERIADVEGDILDETCFR